MVAAIIVTADIIGNRTGVEGTGFLSGRFLDGWHPGSHKGSPYDPIRQASDEEEGTMGIRFEHSGCLGYFGETRGTEFGLWQVVAGVNIGLLRGPAASRGRVERAQNVVS